MKRSSVVLACSAFLAVSTAALAGPPQSRAEPVTDIVHGVELIDAYRWLEGDNSDPAAMGKMTSEIAEWTDAQNEYTRETLDNLPGRKALEARLRELMEVGSISTPTMRGNRYFYSKREGTQAQPIVYLREGPRGAPRPLLDPTEIDKSGLVTVAWYTPNQQGNLLAFGMYRSGDENATLYVMDVDSGKWLADEIPGKVGQVAWLPDSTGFFYRGLEDTANPYSGQVKFHRLGSHHRQDRVLVSQTDPSTVFSGTTYSDERIEALKTTYGPFGYTSRDGRWMILGYYTDTRSNDLWVVDLDRWFRADDAVSVIKAPVIVGERAQNWGPILGDTMYMLTTLDAPNGRVVAVDLNNPDRSNWRDIIPERADGVIEDVQLARGLLTVKYLNNAANRIALFELDGTSAGELELPGLGAASLGTEEDRTEAFLAFESYNEPKSIYRVDLRTGERALWERPDVPVDPSIVDVKQVWYSSKDGTKVSMFIVHRKGLELNGNNPTMLYGYGGFNVSLSPYFSATLFPWFEAGGVYAVPNLRGGGEYGEQWHRSGMLDQKQNVFDDFIAAAQWLIDNGYTKPEKLGIAGGSNGGLLTGAAITQRPDLFSAAIVGVPLLDMIRFHQFLMARYWVPEYGSSDDPGQFEYLIKYSPYQNIKAGTRYPAVLLTAGENDARVHPLHARKMAAALQAATASDPQTDPVLLWVDRDAGHGAGKPLDLRVRDVADSRIFLMWQLGMELETPGR